MVGKKVTGGGSDDINIDSGQALEGVVYLYTGVRLEDDRYTCYMHCYWQ